MKNVFLSKPEIELKKAFEAYVFSCKNFDENYYYDKYKKALDNYEEYLKELEDYEKGINLLEGMVKTSNFWLIDKEVVVGVVRVRHEEMDTAGHIGYDISPSYRKKGYGTEILSLALEKAKELEIEEAIVTCNVNNIASKRIIEKNGGEYLGVIYDVEEDEELFKYKIKL